MPECWDQAARVDIEKPIWFLVWIYLNVLVFQFLDFH